MTAAALALALLVEPLPSPPPEDSIASVRLVMPEGLDERRFAGYLEVRPGGPFDPTQVRKTVELLFATGRFADVVVEDTPSPQGHMVVVKGVSAPLLLATRVEGDRVIGGGTIEKVARLRRGEPIYSKRLEEAAQAVGLFLEADGYLEARVTPSAAQSPAGATAVFRVFAGPRAHVGKILVEGALPTLSARLPPTGAVFRRKQIQKAAEAIRGTLVKEGFWHAKVTAGETYHPAQATMDLLLKVEPGELWSVEFRGSRLPGKLAGSLEALLRDGGLAADAVEEARERIEEAFRAQGYRDVFVSHREEVRREGRTLVYFTESGPEARVASVRIEGFSAEGLEGQLETRVLDPLVDRVVDEDVSRLLRFLQKEGYPAAHVESDVAEGGGSLLVLFRVSPGPRTLVHHLVVDAPKGGPPLPEPRSKTGDPFRESDVALDREALRRAYENAGYLQAAVEADIAWSEDRSEATITLKVSPGPLLDVEHIVIAGLEHTRPEVVSRELLLKTGSPLGSQALLDSQRRLSALGIFNRVTIAEIDPEAPLHRSLVVTAEEARRTAFAYGVGYAEQDLFRGSFEVTEKNLFGMDRSLDVFLRESVKGNGRLLATFREPYLFNHKLELFLTGFQEEEHLQGFAYRRSGGLLQTTFRAGSKAGLIVRFGYQRTELFDVEIPLSLIDRQFQNSTSAGPSLSLIVDTRDDPIYPRSGSFLTGDVQLSSAVFGGDSFEKVYFQASRYRKLVPRVVLAVSGRLGLAATYGYLSSRLLPLPDRFFLGGDNSLRGFALDAVGPTEMTTTGAIVPSGGNALVLGSMEFRVDVGHKVSCAVFSDIGNVFPLLQDFTLSDLRYAAGLGLRYKSAIGPLRVDWGYKLNRRAGESPSHLHLTIGYAF